MREQKEEGRMKGGEAKRTVKKKRRKIRKGNKEGRRTL